MSNKNSNQMAIGAFSKITGVSIDTLRFYEKKGLLIPARDTNNRRVYQTTDLERLALIHRLQSGGFTISEILNIILIRGDGQHNYAQRQLLLAQKLAEIYVRRTEINDSITYLKEKITWLHQMAQKDIEN